MDTRTILLPDGYNGHKVAFFADPVDYDGDCVKLRCAEPGKEYMTAWRKMTDINPKYPFGEHTVFCPKHSRESGIPEVINCLECEVEEG